jgi:hypothetical protein
LGQQKDPDKATPLCEKRGFKGTGNLQKYKSNFKNILL